MKHADDAALDQLDDLLNQIREQVGLKERKRGVFFLHFHEDPAGLFADVRTDADWERVPANTPTEKRRLVAKIKAALRPPR